MKKRSLVGGIPVWFLSFFSFFFLVLHLGGGPSFAVERDVYGIPLNRKRLVNVSVCSKRSGSRRFLFIFFFKQIKIFITAEGPFFLSAEKIGNRNDEKIV